MKSIKAILNIIFYPTRTYKDIKDSKISLLLPVVILIIFFLLKEVTIAKVIASSGRIIRYNIGIMGQKSSLSISPYLSLVKPVIIIPLILLIKALFFYAFNIFLKDKMNFKKYLLLVAYSSQIRIIEALLSMVYYSLFKYIPELGLSLLFQTSGFFHSMLSKITVFSVWEMILIVSGLNYLTGIEKKKGWLVGFVIWAIYILISALISKRV
ncbi:MAG: hypothetical protein B5M53_03915 [Candidatus Cloacimonas sp. 4484_209]|nr:MAG: hypothetical protein B5M53_03915 [Candidatus Cloacimonas sp. 4484_209]RKX93659.1 MAG: hypothetical protein DRP84_08130 [Spirochaetota bacterium]